jgi:RHS repeat-associated protein
VTTLDGFGRPSYVNTNGIAQDIAYNALGFKSFESYPGSTSGTSYGTDVLGRVTGVVHPDTTSRTYSRSGNAVSVRNERNYTTTYTYRSFGDPGREGDRALMRIDAPEAISTVFDRDIIGLPRSVTQGGVTRSYEYNSNNFLITETNPETGVTTYGRDAVGNMTSRQVGASPVTGYAYDGLNRLRTIDYPDTTPDVSYQYDGNNNVTVVDNGIARRTNQYDDNDNLFTETVAIDGLSFSVAYGYNSLDYLTSITYPSLRQVSYMPDAVGRPTTVIPYVNTVAHHPNGVPSGLGYANGQTTGIELNNRQWISRIAAQRPGVGYAMDLSYGYDGLGNVASLTNVVDPLESKTMSYDGVDRLVQAGTESFAYDAAGNITSKGWMTFTYVNNRLDRTSDGLRVYYDSYGNITKRGYAYSYDHASNMYRCCGNSYGYAYDGNNILVRKQRLDGLKLGYFVYVNGNRLIGEYDGTGAWVREHAYLGSKLVATVSKTVGGEEVSYIHTDALGSPVATTNGSGSILSRPAYPPYGSGSTDGTIGFTGHLRLDGLLYAGARWYEPKIGRFMSMDKAAFTERNPHSFNRYAYGNNNPYRYVDPNGMDATDVHNVLEGTEYSASAADVTDYAALTPAGQTVLGTGCGSIAACRALLAVTSGDFSMLAGSRLASRSPYLRIIEPRAAGQGRIPPSWGPGSASRSGGGWKWADPNNPNNQIRIMPGNPNAKFESQREPYVQIRHDGRVIGRGGAQQPDKYNPDAHVPYREWINWRHWHSPG